MTNVIQFPDIYVDHSLSDDLHAEFIKEFDGLCNEFDEEEIK